MFVPQSWQFVQLSCILYFFIFFLYWRNASPKSGRMCIQLFMSYYLLSLWRLLHSVPTGSIFTNLNHLFFSAAYPIRTENKLLFNRTIIFYDSGITVSVVSIRQIESWYTFCWRSTRYSLNYYQNNTLPFFLHCMSRGQNKIWVGKHRNWYCRSHNFLSFCLNWNEKYYESSSRSRANHSYGNSIDINHRNRCRLRLPHPSSQNIHLWNCTMYDFLLEYLRCCMMKFNFIDLPIGTLSFLFDPWTLSKFLLKKK